MAIYYKAIRTDGGRAYDASVNAGEFQAVYAQMKLSSHDYTAKDLHKLTTLADVEIQAGVSEVKKNSDISVSVYAPYTNVGRTKEFDLRTVGLYALHPINGLLLHSVLVASVPDKVPADDGANIVDETFEMILEEVNADNTSLMGDPSGLVNLGVFNNFVQNNTTILGTKADKGRPKEYLITPLAGLVKNGEGKSVYSKNQFENVDIGISFLKPMGVHISNGTLIGALPKGFRPAYLKTAAAVFHDHSTATNTSILATIHPNGSIQFWSNIVPIAPEGAFYMTLNYLAAEE